jgi:hypothetical protein
LKINIFIQQKIYDQNIFQIEDILDQKRVERSAEFIIDVDKRRPDDQRIWAPLLPWDFETLMESMIKELGVKNIRDVGGYFREELRGLLKSSYVISDLKEKSRVDELGYILFESQNYKWLTLLHLYADVYLKPGYEKDMDMAKLYIQYKVADCRGEDTSKYIMEIDDAFEKLDKSCTDHPINMPEENMEYKKIWTHYILYSGKPPFEYVKVEYV